MADTKLKVRGARAAESIASFPEKPAIVAADPIAAAEWDRLLPELEAMGALAKIDAGILAGYCIAFGHWTAAETWVQVNGRICTIRDDKGVVKSSFMVPHIAMGLKMMDQMRKYGEMLGLGALARARMGIDLSPTSPVQSGGFDAFLRSTAG